jgi:hypothetical protein
MPAFFGPATTQELTASIILLNDKSKIRHRWAIPSPPTAVPCHRDEKSGAIVRCLKADRRSSVMLSTPGRTKSETPSLSPDTCNRKL